MRMRTFLSNVRRDQIFREGQVYVFLIYQFLLFRQGPNMAVTGQNQFDLPEKVGGKVRSDGVRSVRSIIAL
jgi:hypothetical protein